MKQKTLSLYRKLNVKLWENLRTLNNFYFANALNILLRNPVKPEELLLDILQVDGPTHPLESFIPGTGTSPVLQGR